LTASSSWTRHPIIGVLPDPCTQAHCPVSRVARIRSLDRVKTASKSLSFGSLAIPQPWKHGRTSLQPIMDGSKVNQCPGPSTCRSGICWAVLEKYRSRLPELRLPATPFPALPWLTR
jgi:hypothetical protein